MQAADSKPGNRWKLLDAVALQVKGTFTESCDRPKGLCEGSEGLKLITMKSFTGRRETGSSRKTEENNTESPCGRLVHSVGIRPETGLKRRDIRWCNQCFFSAWIHIVHFITCVSR